MRSRPTPGPPTWRRRMPRRRCWRASSTCAPAISTAAEAAFRRQIKLGKAMNGGADGGVRAIAATPCWATCSPRARSTTRRWPPTRRRSARSRRCSSATREHVGLRRDLSVTCDRIGDMHAGEGRPRSGARRATAQSLEIAEALAEARSAQHGLAARSVRELRPHRRPARKEGRSRGRAGELPQRPRDRQGAGAARARQHAMAVGPLGQLRPDRRRADRAAASSRRRWSAIAAASPSPRRWPGAIPDTPAGSATWPSATTRSARSRPSAIPSEARELLEKGRAIIARLARIAAHQAQWRSDLSRFDEVLKSLDG